MASVSQSPCCIKMHSSLHSSSVIDGLTSANKAFHFCWQQADRLWDALDTAVCPRLVNLITWFESGDYREDGIVKH